MMTRAITDDRDRAIDWKGAVEALRRGHHLARATISDLFLSQPGMTLMSRGAMIDGLGAAVKSFTVTPGNPARGQPSVQGMLILFAPETGAITALIDSALVTRVKTAADSVLGAMLLARPDSRTLLIVGAGDVARSLTQAYPALMPGLERVLVWARRPEQAQALAAACTASPVTVEAVTDLPAACSRADIISTATMAREPVLHGRWVRPGTHVDLIGAFKADMREADDDLLTSARLFVDSRETTLHHIGEIAIPIASGVIGKDDIIGDLYDLATASVTGRRSSADITVFKNGGGAHLDLMTGNWIAAIT